MDFRLWMMQMGLPTYKTTIPSPISVGVQDEIPIGKVLPTEIGRIFGISTYLDGVTPSNDPLPTTAEASALYLTLKNGATSFYEDQRLSELDYNSGAITSLERYYPVNIPGDFDLSTSFYKNPTGIISVAPAVKTIFLNLFYISSNTYQFLSEQGLVMQNGRKFQFKRISGRK